MDVRVVTLRYLESVQGFAEEAITWMQDRTKIV